MKWVLIWLLMGWLNAPGWMWFVSAVCMLMDTAVYMWRAEDGK